MGEPNHYAVDRWGSFHDGMRGDPMGNWVRYDDHRAALASVTGSGNATVAAALKRAEQAEAELAEIQGELAVIKTAADEMRDAAEEASVALDALEPDLFEALAKAEQNVSENGEAPA